jgi:hypothetical protein
MKSRGELSNRFSGVTYATRRLTATALEECHCEKAQKQATLLIGTQFTNFGHLKFSFQK